jgi:Sterile alpha motif (SAM)/Pointed domain
LLPNFFHLQIRFHSNFDFFYCISDPKEWNTDHIEKWLIWASKKFKIHPPIEPCRFPDTGAELIEMTKADFWVCAGSKAGGNVVAKHFAYLLYSVTGNEQPSLIDDKDPGECLCETESVLSVVYIGHDMKVLLNSTLNIDKLYGDVH